MKWWLAGALVVLCACSGNTIGRREALPDLPEVKWGNFLPAIQEKVREAHDAVRSKPDDAAANGKLGMVLHAHEQFATAEVCYRRAGMLDPKEFRWPYYAALAKASQGKQDLAAESLRRALEIDPDYEPARLKLADQLLSLGRFEEGGELYRTIVEKNPASAPGYYGLGRVQTALKDGKAAAESFAKACELFPSYGAAHYALALAWQKLGEEARARPHFELYEKHKLNGPPAGDPLFAEVRRLNAGAIDHVSAAIRLEAEGKLEEALAAHLKALAADPNLEQAHVNLISLYGRLGEPAKAVEHYRIAVALNPNLPDCHYNYGVLMFGRKRYDEARAAFTKALEINPHYAEAHNNLAFLLEQEGRPDEAESHYRRAVADKPGYRLAHFHLGRLLVSRREFAEAIEHFQKTLTPEDENTPGYMYALGAAYARSGDRRAALEYIRKARSQAARFQQTGLLASIDKDLRTLERAESRRP